MRPDVPRVSKYKQRIKWCKLEDIDDVQKLSSNINISDEVMEKIV